MRGCIQAVDGLLIKIRTPSVVECPKQQSTHTRKDIQALLLIASCDADSIFHWGSMQVVGSTHDISAYYHTTLFRAIQANKLSRWLVSGYSK